MASTPMYPLAWVEVIFEVCSWSQVLPGPEPAATYMLYLRSMIAESSLAARHHINFVQTAF